LSIETPAETAVYVVEPAQGWISLELAELWRYRELLGFMVWRDVVVHIKQAGIGIAWTLVRPVMMMLLFTVVFSRLARLPSDGLPYPLFAFAALLPWTYFSAAVSNSVGGLVANAGLISKIYFPKLVLPLAAVTTPILDFMLSLGALLAMMGWYRVGPSWGVLALPLFLLLAMFTALAVSLWLGALNIQYRDVGQAVPILLQVWLYASPVAYPVSLVPERWRLLYSLNPMTGVIEGFRWALLNKPSPDFHGMAVSAALVLVLLFGGIVYFKRMEGTFADVV
jgi:lipopolysaccharide transport system permease protein